MGSGTGGFEVCEVRLHGLGARDDASERVGLDVGAGLVVDRDCCRGRLDVDVGWKDADFDEGVTQAAPSEAQLVDPSLAFQYAAAEHVPWDENDVLLPPFV